VEFLHKIININFHGNQNETVASGKKLQLINVEVITAV
jgi:hypothetical protein